MHEKLESKETKKAKTKNHNKINERYFAFVCLIRSSGRDMGQ